MMKFNPLAAWVGLYVAIVVWSLSVVAFGAEMETTTSDSSMRLLPRMCYMDGRAWPAEDDGWCRIEGMWHRIAVEPRYTLTEIDRMRSALLNILRYHSASLRPCGHDVRQRS